MVFLSPLWLDLYWPPPLKFREVVFFWKSSVPRFPHNFQQLLNNIFDLSKPTIKMKNEILTTQNQMKNEILTTQNLINIVDLSKPTIKMKMKYWPLKIWWGNVWNSEEILVNIGTDGFWVNFPFLWQKIISPCKKEFPIFICF